jgi:hypothetical protein
MLDALLRVSDSQALTATAVSTDKVPLGAVTPRRRVGSGEPIGFMVSVEVAADFTTGDETYTFQAVSDEDPAIGSPAVLASRAILASALTAGSKHWIPIPPNTPEEQYLALNYVLAGTTPTLTVSAYLVPQSMFDAWMPYAKGYVS